MLIARIIQDRPVLDVSLTPPNKLCGDAMRDMAGGFWFADFLAGSVKKMQITNMFQYVSICCS